MNSIKFLVSADPTYAREVIPAVLCNAHHHFKAVAPFGQGNEKHIYFPAGETFPLAYRVSIEEQDHGDRIMLWTDRPVKRGSTKTTPDNCEMDKLAVEVLIEQSRARLRRKLLPAYRRWYNNFQGIVDARILYIECESVTEAPAGLTGSYMKLSAEGRRAETLAWMKRSLVAYVGARQVHEVTESFEEMLRRLDSRFPWTH